MKNISHSMLLLAVACLLTKGIEALARKPYPCPVNLQKKDNWKIDPSLGGIRLGQNHSEVTKLLGKGKLLFTSPEYVEERISMYEWRTTQGRLQIGFDQEDKVRSVGLTGVKRVQVPGGIYLNEDTIESVRRKLGPPDLTRGPDGDEERYIYSLVYLVGPQNSQEIRFITDLDAGKLRLEPKQVTPTKFAKRTIGKVLIIKHKD